jgi:hypothetical protein
MASDPRPPSRRPRAWPSRRTVVAAVATGLGTTVQRMDALAGIDRPILWAPLLQSVVAVAALTLAAGAGAALRDRRRRSPEPAGPRPGVTPYQARLVTLHEAVSALPRHPSPERVSAAVVPGLEGIVRTVAENGQGQRAHLRIGILRCDAEHDTTRPRQDGGKPAGDDDKPPAFEVAFMGGTVAYHDVRRVWVEADSAIADDMRRLLESREAEVDPEGLRHALLPPPPDVSSLPVSTLRFPLFDPATGRPLGMLMLDCWSEHRLDTDDLALVAPITDCIARALAQGAGC